VIVHKINDKIVSYEFSDLGQVECKQAFPKQATETPADETPAEKL
jgi:hypothetical protein